MDLGAGSKTLLEYWSILVRRRWVIALAVITVTLTTLIGSFMATPLYRATVMLQIERHNPNIFTFNDLAQVDYSWAAYSDFYQTQYRLISSMPVAERAVERLQLASHPDFESVDSGPSLLTRIKSLIPRHRGPTVDRTPEELAALRAPRDRAQRRDVAWLATQPP